MAVLCPTSQGVQKRVKPIAEAAKSMNQAELTEAFINQEKRIGALERLVEELRPHAELGKAVIEVLAKAGKKKKDDDD